LAVAVLFLLVTAVVIAAFAAEALGGPFGLAFLLANAALGGLCLLAGTPLPRRHEWHASARLRHAPAAVWQALIDAAGIPAYPGLGSIVEKLPDNQGRPVWRVSLTGGRQVTWEATEAVAPRRLVVRQQSHECVPLSGDVAWNLEEHEGGTRVTVTTSLETRKVLGRPGLYLYILSARRFHTNGLKRNIELLAAQLGEIPASWIILSAFL
jgi:uncharacterized protein YndB with AHSA1/START domain